MNSEMTTEILAKAIDATKKSVKKKTSTITLEVNNQDIDFRIIHKSASNKYNQLNAMAIAPINSDGKPDYDNVAVVYAGTNTLSEMGG